MAYNRYLADTTTTTTTPVVCDNKIMGIAPKYVYSCIALALGFLVGKKMKK